MRYATRRATILRCCPHGSGVQVSSTYFGFGMDRYTQDMLWPIQYDLGFTWTRVGYDMGMYLWSYVEREKGKLEIDASADAAVTEAHNNGVNVILVLDKGNWLYHDPPRKTDWKRGPHLRSHGHLPGTIKDGLPRAKRCCRDTFVTWTTWYAISRDALHSTRSATSGRESGSRSSTSWSLRPFRSFEMPIPTQRSCLVPPEGSTGPSILACFGQAPQMPVSAGKMLMDGKSGITIATVDGVVEKNVRVSADVSSDAEAGIILRYRKRAPTSCLPSTPTAESTSTRSSTANTHVTARAST